MAGEVARAHRRGRRRVEEGAQGRGHADRPERALVVRRLRVEQALDAKCCVRIGVAQHRVDAAAHLRRAALEVDPHIAVLHPHAAVVEQRVLESVEFERVTVFAVGDFFQRAAHRLLRGGLDRVRERAEVVDVFFDHQVDQALRAHGVGGDQRLHIAHHLVGGAGVVFEQIKQQLDAHAFVIELARRDAQSFLEHVARACRVRHAADVHHMAHRAGERDQPSLVEHRHHHVHVGQVAGAHPRVVGEQHIAGCERRSGEPAQAVLGGLGHGADERGRALGGLHQ